MSMFASETMQWAVGVMLMVAMPCAAWLLAEHRQRQLSRQQHDQSGHAGAGH